MTTKKMAKTPHIETLPIRARVALALAAARRAATGAERARILEALDAGLRWTAGAPTSAREIYDRVHTLYPLEREFASDAAAKAALFSAISALYYAAWHAARFAPRAPQLPHDMAEIDEDTLPESLEYAEQAAHDSAAFKTWLNNSARKLAALGGGEADELGPVIPMDVFGEESGA